MTCVVDASVALKWFLADEQNGAEALGLVRHGEPLLAPDLLVAEVCNAGWRLLRVRRIPRAQFDNIPTVLPRYFADLVGIAALAPRAAAIAAQLDHPIYDCFYLALAEARDAPVVTADGRFLRRLEGTQWSTSVVHLADYRPEG